MAKKLGRRRRLLKLRVKPKTLNSLGTLLFFLAAGVTFLAFAQRGAWLIWWYRLLNQYIGMGMFFLPFLLLSCGLLLSGLRWRLGHPNVLLGILVISLSVISLGRAGLLGVFLWQNSSDLVTSVGAFFIFLILTAMGVFVATNISFEEMAVSVAKLSDIFRKGKNRAQVKMTQPLPVKYLPDRPLKIGSSELREDTRKIMVSNLPSNDQSWHYPPLSLLEDVVSGKADRGDVKQNAEVIERTLESFGVIAKVNEVNPGPAVTQYALEIASGTKLSKVTTLANDLAMAMAAPTGQIRIEAPIPGRSLVGVEVPNHTPEFVPLKRILNSSIMKKQKSKLAVALGLNVAGEAMIADIAKMPHALIAGSTGSGKSVCLHSFISSILFRASPSEVKLLMIDPKRVELTQYNDIPHLVSPVVVDPAKVLSALKWAIGQMEYRYKLFAERGSRNIEVYNEDCGYVALPYLVIIIDELADIMLFAPSEVEEAICRIAQMARATGIHLVVSTQRPSVDVITGLIKANIPCRIAFNVSSQIDSRVIIDGPGAEKLLGRGDMLYVPPDQAKPTRIQGTYISDKETRGLIEYLHQTGKPNYAEGVTDNAIVLNRKGGVAPTGANETDEGLFAAAVREVCAYKRASASLLQRRLSIGYARAARIIDQLVEEGVVGQQDASKAREILISDPEEFLANRKR